ncbi:MAG: serine/threonine protein kinase [Deltaproteobacteria bacterium]|nr:serine/threonine protein kinase [Deltaproteobacteria bacterium]MBP7289157.1 serine/threonine protein kinase [Nannocystaceae bacterium]
MSTDERHADSRTAEADDAPGDVAVSSRESWLTALARAPAISLGPAAGDVLGGEYVIERALGQGAMGLVYLAHHPTLARKVAIKLHRLRSEGAAARQLAEARAVARIQHENVLVVHGVGTWRGHVFVAMEFIDGTTARQWVTASPRSWREVVALYLEAGRGLAAAHAQGLVHRDFKPDNVLVPRDADGHAHGRVKVADFGLARDADEAVDDATAETTTGGSPHATPPARAGGLVGSPAYMAPEQYRRADVDARADQFAFCVSLFEALFGRRPFEGDDLPALAAAITVGRVHEPEGADVPLHVRRVLRRGLSVDPAARFPDMPALLDALARDPAATRRRALAAVVAVGIGATAMWSTTRRDDPLPECLASPAVSTWWSPELAAPLHDALIRSGRAHAEATYLRVDAAFAEHRDDAATVLARACEATHVAGTLARVELEARRTCLAQRGRELGALIEVLERGTPEIVDRAVSAAEGLTPVTRCEQDADAIALDDRGPEVAPVLDRLAQARSLRLVGRFDEAAKMASEGVVSARALARPGLLAELLLEQGVAMASNGAETDASASLREAASHAVLAGADALAAEIAAQGLFVDAYRNGSRGLGEQWAALGWAWLERAHWPTDVLREFLGQRALARRTADRHAEALVDLGLALALAQGERSSSTRAALLAVLAETYRRIGMRELARSTATDAHAAYVAALGERHPFAINALNLIAGLDLEEGRFAEAETLLRRILALGEEVLGPDSRRLIDPRVNLATVLVNTGRLSEALEMQQRAYDVVSAPGEPTNESRVLVTANLAADLAMTGNLVRARELQQEAVELARAVAGERSALYARQLATAAELVMDADPERALSMARDAEERLAAIAPLGLDRKIAGSTVAVALALLERCDAAREPLATSLTTLGAEVGEDNPGIAGLIAANGHCEAEAGRHEAGLALLERAARLNDAVMPPSPMILEWQVRAELGRGKLVEARAAYRLLLRSVRPDDAKWKERIARLAQLLRLPPRPQSP